MDLLTLQEAYQIDAPAVFSYKQEEQVFSENIFLKNILNELNAGNVIPQQARCSYYVCLIALQIWVKLISTGESLGV